MRKWAETSGDEKKLNRRMSTQTAIIQESDPNGFLDDLELIIPFEVIG